MVQRRAAQAAPPVGGSIGTDTVAIPDTHKHATVLSSTMPEGLDYIIAHESRGKTTAKNPKSSAFGIGQLLIGNRQKYGKMFGVDPNTTDPDAQMKMMLQYIKDRYGSVDKAVAFHKSHGWY